MMAYVIIKCKCNNIIRGLVIHFLYLCLQQRQNLQVQLAALQADYDNLNVRYEEESENASMYRQQVRETTLCILHTTNALLNLSFQIKCNIPSIVHVVCFANGHSLGVILKCV